MYDNVLLATDGSEGAAAAAEHALAIAEQNGATLHALYVVNTGGKRLTENVTDAGEVEASLEPLLEEEGEETLADVERRANGAGVAVRPEIRRGRPHDEIVEYAAEAGIDLVVMGTHGHGRLGKFLLGSVTDRVVRAAGTPVLVVRADGSTDRNPR